MLCIIVAKEINPLDERKYSGTYRCTIYGSDATRPRSYGSYISSVVIGLPVTVFWWLIRPFK